ncbi:MAG: hypothetical protein JWR80_6038 [Bradyrhizobium sp.]|nr:hypothetical protein [Bradyrhizobium sp.]
MFNSIPERIKVTSEQTRPLRFGSVDVALPNLGC